MKFTGERMTPEDAPNSTFWEHVYRYRMAAAWAAGRDVLDIACGEGYGTAALQAAGARDVLGVDICEEACRHATTKYGVRTLVGSATDIPCSDASRDLIVSFETIEHVEQPERFLDEALRVLRPDGVLIVSTPNRDVYRETIPSNPFHLSEMEIGEFTRVLQARFRDLELRYQSPRRCRWWSPHHLAAGENPVCRVRGYRRAVRLLQQLFCPHLLETEENLRHRLDPVRTILSREIADQHWLNPYSVRETEAAGGIEPTYVVAICRR